MPYSRSKRRRGDFGEEAVCLRLSEVGYTIIGRNFKKSGGEIDIIAEKDALLIFVEVKTRKPHSMESGKSAITRAKQSRIINTAQLFLLNAPEKREKEIRFDAAEVIITESDPPELISVNYIENAYEPVGKNTYLFI